MRGKPPPVGSRGENDEYVQSYMTDQNYDRIERLSAWSRERGHGMNELAQSWLLAQPQVCSVISGATRPEHVLRNAKAADWYLVPDELEEINTILLD